MKGLTCLLSPSLQGDSSTWEPGKRVYTDKQSCCWRTWWLYVYVHSCTEEQKVRWWEISADSCYSFTWKTNTLAWILPLTKSSTNLTDFKRHQERLLGCFKPPQNCSCHWGIAGTKENVYKSCWKNVFHETKDFTARSGLWLENKRMGKKQKRGRNTTNQTMCNPLFSGKSSRGALQLAVGEERWYIANVCSCWDSVPKYHKNKG